MNWKTYKLVYRATSPIHIGWHTLGYINLTRYYIPGKNIWAAFTESLTRMNFLNLNNNVNEIYKMHGDFVKDNIKTSYFYPATKDNLPLMPKFTTGGLLMGDYPITEFERLVIKSLGQTAISPGSNTAEDESLHESEFISPRTSDGWPVSFVGYVLVNEDGLGHSWDRIKDTFKEISIGGDRKYGWGRLELELPCLETAKFFGFDMDFSDATMPKIVIPADCHIPAHVTVNNELKLKGDIEPLVGRDWGTNGEGKSGAGKKVTGSQVCWVPGSVLLEEKTLKISEHGMLSL